MQVKLYLLIPLHVSILKTMQVLTLSPHALTHCWSEAGVETLALAQCPRTISTETALIIFGSSHLTPNNKLLIDDSDRYSTEVLSERYRKH